MSASDVCWLFCQKLIWTNPITPFETPRLPNTVPFSNQPKMKRCFDHLYPPLVQIDFAFVGTVECRPDFPNRSALQSTTHSRARMFACLHSNMLRLINCCSSLLSLEDAAVTPHECGVSIFVRSSRSFRWLAFGVSV